MWLCGSRCEFWWGLVLWPFGCRGGVCGCLPVIVSLYGVACVAVWQWV